MCLSNSFCFLYYVFEQGWLLDVSASLILFCLCEMMAQQQRSAMGSLRRHYRDLGPLSTELSAVVSAGSSLAASWPLISSTDYRYLGQGRLLLHIFIIVASRPKCRHFSLLRVGSQATFVPQSSFRAFQSDNLPAAAVLSLLFLVFCLATNLGPVSVINLRFSLTVKFGNGGQMLLVLHGYFFYARVQSLAISAGLERVQSAMQCSAPPDATIVDFETWVLALALLRGVHDCSGDPPLPGLSITSVMLSVRCASTGLAMA